MKYNDLSLFSLEYPAVNFINALAQGDYGTEVTWIWMKVDLGVICTAVNYMPYGGIQIEQLRLKE